MPLTDHVFAVRAQKSLGLVGGPLPAQYSPLDLDTIPTPAPVVPSGEGDIPTPAPATNGGGGNNAARMHAYSPNGSLYAVAWPSGCVLSSALSYDMKR